MKVPGSGLRMDNPAFPLLQAQITFWDISDANGNVLGTTIVCGNLANEPSYMGQAIKVLNGDAAGQVRPIAIHVAGANTLTVVDPFTDNAGAVVQIVASTRFVILSAAGGGGAPAPALAPSIGLWMFGECDPGMAASDVTVVCPNLAGFPDDIFNNEFWMQVIHNANAVGVAPEREIRRITDYVGATGTFTVDAFTADVEANDLVAIFHESILSVEILGFGTLDTSSATVPEDSTRTEGVDYFKGCLLMTTEGAVRFQPRRIVTSSAAVVFTLDPNNPFTAAPGLVDYIIIGGQAEFIPGVDGTNNRTPSDVVGGKADTAIIVPDDVSSIIRYLKGVLNAVGATFVASGTFDTSSATVPADSGRAEANDYFNGCLLIPVAGGVLLQPRVIVDYTGAGGIFEVDPNNPFTAATGNVDYVVLSFQWPFVPGVDATINLTTPDVIGQKASTAVYAKDNASDVIRYLKGILDANISASGTADAGSGVGLIRDAARTEVDDWWNGQTILMLTGAAAGQKRPIVDFLAATDDIIVSPDFDAAPGAGDIYVILADYNPIVPRSADSVLNALTSQVIGRKDDTIPAMNLAPAATWSIIRHLKAILERLGATPADPDDSVLTSAGQRDTAATADDMSALDAANLHAKVRRALLRIAVGAYSVTVDPGGTARVDIETTLGDLGAMLAGAGITTYPAAAAPGDGVSIAEVIREIYNLIAASVDVFQEQADIAVNINAINASETDVFDLSVAATRYIVRSLRLKCADPGADTVTVRLYELVNDAAIEVASFDITTANFTSYYSLMDMFGLPHLAGDDLQVTVRASAGGPYAVTGQYSHAIA